MKFALLVLGTLLIFAVWVLLLLNLMTGCGEVYHHADGSTSRGECVVINWEK